MYILAIETTGPYGSVALIDGGGEICGYEVSENTKSHLQDLIPMIDTMLKKAGVKKEEITYVAPSIGPGSFTGIRIGVSTARALAQVLGTRCIGVPTLDAFCYKLPADEEAGKKPVVCAIINARRGQVYGMVDGYMEAGPYMLVDVLEVLKTGVPGGTLGGVLGNEKVIFFGDGINAYRKQIDEELAVAGYAVEKDYYYIDEEFRHQDAICAARWALAQYEKRGEACVTEYEQLLPDYMRKAEAEQKLEAGQLPICKGPKQE